jgi:hypothetical protein
VHWCCESDDGSWYARVADARGRPCHRDAWEGHDGRAGPRRCRAVGDRRDIDLAADSRVAASDPPGLGVCSAVVASSPGGSVIGGRGFGDEPMLHHPCPGECPERGMALLIHKAPTVPSGSPGLAPVLLGSPPARFVRVASRHVPLSASVHEGVQIAEHPGSHAGAEGLAPASDQRVHHVDQRHGGRAHMLSPEGFERPSDLLDGAPARLDQQLVAAARALGRWIMPDVEPQEIEALRAAANVGYLFRQPQSSCPQPIIFLLPRVQPSSPPLPSQKEKEKGAKKRVRKVRNLGKGEHKKADW